MELVAFDDHTVTVRMDQREEFFPMCSLILSVCTQYESLDEIELGMTSDQVMALFRRLEQIGARLPRTW